MRARTQPYLPMFEPASFRRPPIRCEPSVADPTADVPSGPIPAPAQSEVVPGTYQYLKRWTFVLVVAGVWIVGGRLRAGPVLLVVPLTRQDARRCSWCWSS